MGTQMSMEKIFNVPPEQELDTDGDNSKEDQKDDAISINEQQMETGPETAVIHCPLPLELNAEIFKCLALPIQRKFIWGLGKGIYSVFRQKLLSKTTRIKKPHPNTWNRTNTKASISRDGLEASMDNDSACHFVFADKRFDILSVDCRKDMFPGTIIYYFEVILTRILSKWLLYVGLSNGNIPDDQMARDSPNCYGIYDRDYDEYCWHDGQRHRLELPHGGIKPEWKARLPWELPNGERQPLGDVVGCGLLIDSENKLAIFFTLNGILRGKKIAISPVENCFFPTIKICGDICVEANFGDDPTKPFKFDILQCPELNFFAK